MKNVQICKKNLQTTIEFMNCRISRYQNLILRKKLVEKMTKNLKYDQMVMILEQFWCHISLNQMIENLKFSQKI